ncbi:hypothetical protein FRC17_001331 [Serendipita sp. 399]|nr:hypothetical protein FRC17_001331 [Serendipita sp. 399]
MRSIEALPQELWQQISAQLNRSDLLKFRLVAPREILPQINSVLFEDLVVDVDGTDDLTRWEEAEADGVAIRRLQQVAKSRIADHVRILTLRLTRPYSLSAYYEEKLGVKKYPYGKAPLEDPSLTRRVSSLFTGFGKPSRSRSPKPRKHVDYESELSSALQDLFKATDLVKLVRIVQPSGYNSEYDLVYPSVYARVLVRVFRALQDVAIPSEAALEIWDCPVTHLEESGLSIDKDTIVRALSKFSKFALSTRTMGYAVVKPGSLSTITGNRNYSARSYSPTTLPKNGLGHQFLRGLGAGMTSLQAIKIKGSQQQVRVFDLLFDGDYQWPHLTHVELETFQIQGDILARFLTPLVPQLHTLVMKYGSLEPSTGISAYSLLELLSTWIALRKSLPPTEWKLEKLEIYSGYSSSYGGGSDSFQSSISQLVLPPKPKPNARAKAKVQ